MLTQTAEDARRAFDALSGEVHATVGGVLADENRYVREAILARLMQSGYAAGPGSLSPLAAAGPQVASLSQRAMTLGAAEDAAPSYGPGPAFWTRGYGAWADFDGNRNTAEAERDLGGFVSGLDARVAGSWRLGIASGFSRSNIDVDARFSAADVESTHLAGYAGGKIGGFRLRSGGA